MKKSADTPNNEDFAALYARAWDTLIPARANYLADVTPHYDEVFHETSRRTEHVGSLGKTDIAALVVWKRLSAQTRSVTDLMSLPDTHVRAVTERAVTAVRDATLTRSEAARSGRGIIWELPGFRTGDALASAVLTTAAPQRMAVYDRRVQHALDTLGLPLTPPPGRYGRYLRLLDDLLQHGGAHADGWTARDIDTALYRIGKPNRRQAPDQYKPASALQMPNTITNTTPPLSTNPQQPQARHPVTTASNLPQAPESLSENHQHPNSNSPHHTNYKPPNHNTRTKRIMRQMHGRAGFDLLRHRILLP